LREYTPVTRAAVFANSSRSKVRENSSVLGCFSFGLTTLSVVPAIDRKSRPFGSRLTSPASYSLLPLLSCQSQIVVAIVFWLTLMMSGLSSRS
jgi:hypothetical protein